MPKDHYHIAAPMPEAVVTQTYRLIDDIRTNGVTREKRTELYNTIMRLTESSTDFFFMEPLRRMEAGPMLQKMASMGIGSMLKGTRMVIHNIIKKAEDRHIEGMLVFMEEILFEPESP